MSLYQLIDRFLPRRLQIKLSLLVTALLIFLISLIGALFSDSSEKLLREQIGDKALEVAQSIALNKEIRDALAQRDTRVIQPVAEAIRKATGAEYVVVGDTDGVRYSHPQEDRIGRHFVGGDIDAALNEGKAYFSQAVGTLGPSLRGIVPIRDDNATIIGFVAVGYLTSDIESLIREKQFEILGYVVIVLVFGIFGATAIAHGLKSAIMGLEVHEIAGLFHERNAIISAIREGIIAVDGEGVLTYVNDAARLYLGEEFERNLRGQPLKEICPCPDLARALAEGEKRLDCEMHLRDRPMIVNILPLDRSPQGGLVASFRPKDELDRLTRELSYAQEYSELLRTQTHEYSNKMHTIAGLIQLGAHREALDLVINEASGYQQLIRNLAETVPDPVIAGVILGKYNRACELKIDLEFDPQNSFVDLPADMERETLVTILGNLLDNAFDAVREAGGHLVRLYLTDFGPDLIIEVEDSGSGVAEEVSETLFNSGVSTKSGSGRGTGLALVKRAVDSLDGEITYGDGELGGSLFTVIIPKK